MRRNIQRYMNGGIEEMGQHKRYYWLKLHETHMETARKMGYRSTSAVTNVVGRALKKMRGKADDRTNKNEE